jgi:Response regulators consisting of a CheY-like receiver domain and a winged-helix DNA-binding domain
MCLKLNLKLPDTGIWREYIKIIKRGEKSVTKKNILVVDDEINIINIVKAYLEKNGCNVQTALSGKQVLEQLNETLPSLIILDLMLPDISGEEICAIIRKRSTVPIIMLTAKVKKQDIIDGFDIGADDYVTRPFSPKQLVARVAAILRRSSEEPASLANQISFNNGDLIIGALNYEVKKNGESVRLTPNEYRILVTLVKHPEKAYTRCELVSTALQEDSDGCDRVVDTHIKNIRHKIETDPRSPDYILTVHGIGYRFQGEKHPL